MCSGELHISRCLRRRSNSGWVDTSRKDLYTFVCSSVRNSTGMTTNRNDWDRLSTPEIDCASS